MHLGQPLSPQAKSDPQVKPSMGSVPPGQSYGVPMLVVFGTSPELRLVLRWRDGKGERFKELALSVF